MNSLSRNSYSGCLRVSEATDVSATHPTSFRLLSDVTEGFFSGLSWRIVFDISSCEVVRRFVSTRLALEEVSVTRCVTLTSSQE